MKPTRILLLTAAALLLSFCRPKNADDFELRVRAIQTAVNQHRMDSLQPYMATGYTIQGLPEGMESLLLPALIQKMPALESYEIVSQTKEKKGTRLVVKFRVKGQPEPLQSNFLVARDGKFLEFNILDGAKVDTSIN